MNMKPTVHLSRRGFLQVAGVSAVGALAAACGGAVAPATNTAPAVGTTASPSANTTTDAGSSMSTPMPAAQAADPNFKPDIEINLRATIGEQAIFEGATTRVWRYQGEVTKGEPNVVQPVPDSYLGPIFRFKRGQKVRVTFTNGLAEPSIVHWHGLHVPTQSDGQPQQAIGAGATYRYEFEVKNRAGTYWFHPHPHKRTAYQAYMGLAGLILVSDDEEAKLGLPSGEFDLPVVLQDRIVDQQNQFVYPTSLMALMHGVVGDQILVNGQPDAGLALAATAYRLRFLNGSNMRTYKLAWEDATPWTVIATDGGLLEQPVQRPYLALSPGERVEVYVDFSGRASGSQLKLLSQSFAGGMMPMMGGMLSGAPGGNMMGGINTNLPNGAEFTVLTVRIDRAGEPARPLPQKLSSFARLSEAEAVNASNPRRFSLGFSQMQWTLNGRTFAMNEVADDEVVKLNTTEVWSFDNSGMMDMGMMTSMNGGMMGGNMMGSGMMGAMNRPMMNGMPAAGNTPGGMVTPGSMMNGTAAPGGMMSGTPAAGMTPGGMMTQGTMMSGTPAAGMTPGGMMTPGSMMNGTPAPGGTMSNGMMGMVHAMHLHGVQFLIVDRQVAPQAQADWKTIGGGLVDEGWKDTFLIMPGEQVKFVVRFSDFTGTYLYHCHILEHDDLGMMRYYRVDA